MTMLSTIAPQIPYGLLPQGRLSTSNTNPLFSSAGTTTNTVFYAYDRGSLIPLYDSAAGQVRAISFTPQSRALSTVVPFQLYDVFGFLSSNDLSLEKLEWANVAVTMAVATPGVVTLTNHNLVTGCSVTFTTSGAMLTGLTANTQYFVNVLTNSTFNIATSLANLAAGTYVAFSGTQSGTHTAHSPTYRQTDLTLQNNLWCKSGDPTRLYLGSFLAGSTTSYSDSNSRRGLWNMYNRVPLPLASPAETTDNWNNTLDVWRQANANGANMVEAIYCDPAGSTGVSGLGYGAPGLSLTALGIASNASSVTVASGIGIDSTNTNVTSNYGALFAAGGAANTTSSYSGALNLGYHQITWLERSQATGTTNWRGDNGTPARVQTGLSGSIMG